MHKIKYLLGILIISLLGFINISSAGYTRQIGVYGYNPFIQNFDVNFTKNGNPLTQNLGYTKQLFAIMQGNTYCNYRDSTVRIYWRRYNGIPYYYIYYYTPGYLNPVTKQGNITTYNVCDEIIDYTSTSQPGNCVENSVGESTKDIFGNFLSTLNNDDNFYFDYSCNTYSYGDNMYRDLNAPFCISNSNVGHSLCFNPGISRGGNGNLSGSAGVPFGYDYDSISTNFLQNPPKANNNGGGTTNNTNTYSCPTIQQLINTYGTQYNTGLCYSSSLIYSGGSIHNVTPKSIFELRPTYTGFTADINLYNSYCVGPNTTTACQTAFNQKTEEYTLIAKMPNDVNKTNLYQYCNLQLNYQDKNATTCTLTGTTAPGIKETVTNEDVINAIINGNYGTITPSTETQNSSSGTAFNELLTDQEQLNGGRENVKTNRNIIESFDNLYTKITGIFSGREGQNGIIPEYITRILLIIVLFTLFKI